MIQAQDKSSTNDRERERDREKYRARERESETGDNVMDAAFPHAMERYEFVLYARDAWVVVHRRNDNMLR